MQDHHNPPSDTTDPKFKEANAESTARLRALADAIDRGEEPSFALVYQHDGRPPRFSYRATGDGLVGYIERASVLVAVMDEMRGHLVQHIAKARQTWAEGDAGDGGTDTDPSPG